MINTIKNLIGNYQILFICKTGSQIFCDNCNDKDYLVVVKDFEYAYKKFNKDNVDYFCYSLAEFNKLARMELNDQRDVYAVELLLNDVVYGENPIYKYDWFDYQKRAIEVALKRGETGPFNPRVRHIKGGCSKQMVWQLAIYFAIKNQSTLFTAEQRELLQKCHDGELPVSYAEELKTNLEALIKGDNTHNETAST